MLPKLARQIKNVDPELLHRSIKIVPGLNADFQLRLDYAQSPSTRIEELRIDLVRRASIRMNLWNLQP
jgi:hypothetical protein